MIPEAGCCLASSTVHQRGDAAVGDDELRELGRARHLADRGRRVFPHKPVHVLQARQNRGEHLRLHHRLRQSTEPPPARAPRTPGA